MSGFSVVDILYNYYYHISIFCLLLHAYFWQLTLKNIPLNVAYLYKSLHYPIILFMSYFIFYEEISLFNIAGIILIVTGVIYISKNRRNV